MSCQAIWQTIGLAPVTIHVKLNLQTGGQVDMIEWPQKKKSICTLGADQLRSLNSILKQHGGTLFANHDSCCIGVGRYHSWHDRGIDHPKLVHASDTKT